MDRIDIAFITTNAVVFFQRPGELNLMPNTAHSFRGTADYRSPNKIQQYVLLATNVSKFSSSLSLL